MLSQIYDIYEYNTNENVNNYNSAVIVMYWSQLYVL